ncbi:MAG: tryptophan 2,3-dioxygenase family protein [Kiloniellales bacterium]
MDKSRAPLGYSEYLQLDRLLSAQRRMSEAAGQPAHDELLFIVVHQAYELWFKLILFELARIERIFAGPVADERDIGRAVQGLTRVVEVQKLLIQQIEVLETMTPLDFLDFRDLLIPASGFQSLQFRLIETRLGLRRAERSTLAGKHFDALLPETDRRQLKETEAAPSLHDLVERWLARTPFVALPDYSFRDAYRQAVVEALEADVAHLRARPGAASKGGKAELGALEAARARFDALFEPERYAALKKEGQWRMAAEALQAALFITLYRDEPVAQQPFALLRLLMDVDEKLTAWRTRHALMVQRMIGRKVGTGGSAGYDYLQATVERHRIFGDLFALSTYLIPRSKLPPLPPKVRRAMGYSYGQPRE